MYPNNSLIFMNTLNNLKKCIQIDLSEYTLFLNTKMIITNLPMLYLEPTRYLFYPNKTIAPYPYLRVYLLL